MIRPDSPGSLASNGHMMFKPSPSAASAWWCAGLEPVIATLVFFVLAGLLAPVRESADPVWKAVTPWSYTWPVLTNANRAVSGVDIGLLLLMLALTFPAPDHLFAPRWQRWSAAIGSTVMLAGVLLLCAWATHGLQAMSVKLWAAWALVTPVVHQGVLGLVARAWTRWAARVRPPSAVVVGMGPVGIRAARALRRLKGVHARTFYGWVELSETPRPSNRPYAGNGTGRSRRLGGLAALEQLLRSGKVQEVYLATPMQVADAAANEQLWRVLQDSTVTVRWIPDVLHTVVVKGQVGTLEGLPLIGVLESPYDGPRAALKRLSDVVLATLALLLLWPLMLGLAVAVRWDSPGPALFKQRRLGCNGQVIEVWKYRTMTVMEDGERIEQARQGDARITRLGRLLRRTSLDELPQFINVLQGRMSVVGPRPHALAHNEHYRRLVTGYMVRHKVRPGITGWAQVNGLRGETDTVDKMRRRIEHDLYYLQNWSLLLDLQVVLRTVVLVFKDARAW